MIIDENQFPIDGASAMVKKNVTGFVQKRTTMARSLKYSTAVEEAFSLPVTATACPCNPPNDDDRLRIPTRGEPGEAKLVGYLVQAHYNGQIPLFGGPRWPRDTEWQYYVDQQGIKIPIVNRYGRQLWTNNTVDVPGRSGVWSVKLYSIV